MTLAAGVYLSMLGKQGLNEVARLCYDKAHYAAARIADIEGYRLWSKAPFFHEFVIECPRPVAEINEYLLSHGILGGYDLLQDYPPLDRHMLIAVTEMISKEEIDDLVDALEEVSND